MLYLVLLVISHLGILKQSLVLAANSAYHPQLSLPLLFSIFGSEDEDGAEGYKSGGIASNIGIHFFDMLIRLFGYPTSFSIKENDPERLEGTLDCPLAQIDFCLSIRQEDLPQEVRNSDQRSWRQMMIDGEPFDFTNGFTDLHTKSYEEILAGRGFGLQEALPAVSLCESILRAKYRHDITHFLVPYFVLRMLSQSETAGNAS